MKKSLQKIKIFSFKFNYLNNYFKIFRNIIKQALYNSIFPLFLHVTI